MEWCLGREWLVWRLVWLIAEKVGCMGGTMEWVNEERNGVALGSDAGAMLKKNESKRGCAKGENFV
jgi:hypothetical protein